MISQFRIHRTEILGDVVHVHAMWTGGGEIFIFPKAYPTSTILSQIRIELRRRAVEGGTNEKFKDLLGDHDV
jgi:hypothetical protein